MFKIIPTEFANLLRNGSLMKVYFCVSLGRILWADDKCDGKESLGRLVEIHDSYDIHGVLGLPCSIGNIMSNITICVDAH